LGLRAEVDPTDARNAISRIAFGVSDDRAEHPGEGGVKELLDRLDEILKGLLSDRQRASREHLDGLTRIEADDGGDTEEGGRKGR
jgi:hypothetical protein